MNQFECLSPLQNAAELMPSLLKFDNLAKMLIKKNDDIESKFMKLEKMIDKKPTEKQKEKHDECFKDLENKLIYSFKTQESKIKEEVNLIQKSLDYKLEKIKQEVDRSISSQYQHSIPSIKTRQQSEEKSLILVISDIEKRTNDSLNNTYKLIGSLRCDVEFLNSKINQNNQSESKNNNIPPEINGVSRNLLQKIQELENKIQDMEEYEGLTTTRLESEIGQLCEVMGRLTYGNQDQQRKEREYQAYKMRVEIINWQLIAIKHKYFAEINNIDQMFQQINQMALQLPQQVHPVVSKAIEYIDKLENNIQQFVTKINHNTPTLQNALNQMQYNL